MGASHLENNKAGAAGPLASAGIKSMQIEAVIIRADGTREDLGTISRWDSSWIKRAKHFVFGQWKKSWNKFKELTTNRSD